MKNSTRRRRVAAELHAPKRRDPGKIWVDQAARFRLSVNRFSAQGGDIIALQNDARKILRSFYFRKDRSVVGAQIDAATLKDVLHVLVTPSYFDPQAWERKNLAALPSRQTVEGWKTQWRLKSLPWAVYAPFISDQLHPEEDAWFQENRDVLRTFLPEALALSELPHFGSFLMSDVAELSDLTKFRLEDGLTWLDVFEFAQRYGVLRPWLAQERPEMAELPTDWVAGLLAPRA